MARPFPPTYKSYQATFLRSDVYEVIPAGMRDTLIRWVLYGHKPGSFLESVVSNDLLAACTRADPVSRTILYSLVHWLYNCAPALCFGDRSVFRDWKGLNAGRIWVVTYLAGVPGETRRPLENQFDNEAMLFDSVEEASAEIERIRELHQMFPDTTAGFNRFLESAQIEEWTP